MSQPTTGIKFNTTTPSAPGSKQNIVFQSDNATPQQSVTAYDPDMLGDTGAGGTAGNVPAPPSGSAAAGKFLKADGTWAVPAGGGGGGGSPYSTAPLTLPAASTGATTYTLPSTPASPAGSLYFVRRLKWVYGTDYSISGTTLTILNTADAPDTGDIHELYAS